MLLVILEQGLHRQRERAERGLDLAQPLLDALGDRDLAFTGQQLYCAHLAHVHAHRIGGAATLGVERGQRGSGFFGGGVVDFAVAGVAVVQQ